MQTSNKLLPHQKIHKYYRDCHSFKQLKINIFWQLYTGIFKCNYQILYDGSLYIGYIAKFVERPPRDRPTPLCLYPVTLYHSETRNRDTTGNNQEKNSISLMHQKAEIIWRGALKTSDDRSGFEINVRLWLRAGVSGMEGGGIHGAANARSHDRPTSLWTNYINFIYCKKKL